MFWWQKMGKVVNRVKLAIVSQSEPHFGRKDGKTCKMTKIGHFEPIDRVSYLLQTPSIIQNTRFVNLWLNSYKTQLDGLLIV